jgi:toxin ParE1/3/4
MKYRISPAARADLRGIWEYTADNWSTARADKYILSIESLYRSLSTGRVRGRTVNHVKLGYLRAGIGSHFVFYRVSAIGTLDVIRVLHKRMNFAAHLPDDLGDFEDE